MLSRSCATFCHVSSNRMLTVALCVSILSVSPSNTTASCNLHVYDSSVDTKQHDLNVPMSSVFFDI